MLIQTVHTVSSEQLLKLAQFCISEAIYLELHHIASECPKDQLDALIKVFMHPYLTLYVSDFSNNIIITCRGAVSNLSCFDKIFEG